MKFTLYMLILLFTWIPFNGNSQEDKHFGESKKIFQQQIINPKASDNHDPVTGIRGTEGEIVYKKYVDSFGDSKGGKTTPKIDTSRRDPGQDNKDAKNNFEEENKKRLAKQQAEEEDVRKKEAVEEQNKTPSTDPVHLTPKGNGKGIDSQGDIYKYKEGGKAIKLDDGTVHKTY